MLRTVELKGMLGDKYGKKHEFAIDKPVDAFSALCQIKEFRENLSSYNFNVIRKMDNDIYLTQESLDMHLGKCKHIIIQPPIEGAGIEFLVFGTIIVGLTLLRFFTKVRTDDFEAPDDQASFLFNNQVNSTEQGAAIPLVYGRVRTGSVTVSSGVAVEAYRGNSQNTTLNPFGSRQNVQRRRGVYPFEARY